MQVHSSTDIGLLVRTTRKDARITQTELAERAGCSQRFVSQLEMGKRTAEVGKVLDVLMALGLVVDIAQRTRVDGRTAVAHAMELTSRKLEMGSSGIHARSLADYLHEAGAHEPC